MRVTTHNARVGKDGAFMARHNDRDFDVAKAEHIDQEKSRENVYWHLFQEKKSDMSFEDAELQFYREHFGKALQEQNERYKRNGHPERIKTIDEIYRNPRSCPEECIFQVGSLEDGTIDLDILLDIYKEYKEEREKDFPNLVVLDYALHVDERGSPHIHERLAWLGHDKNGNEIPSQNRALKEMGVARLYPDKPQGRYNNPKQLYSRLCRLQALSICQKHGLQVECQPKDASRTGFSLLEFQKNKDLEAFQNQLQERQEQIKVITTALIDLNAAEKRLQTVMTASERRMTDIAHRRKDEAFEKLFNLQMELER